MRASLLVTILSTALIALSWWAFRHPALLDGLSADAASYVEGTGFLLIPLAVLLDWLERRRSRPPEAFMRDGGPDKES